jgi:cytoskeleton protein RodZ
MRDHLEHRVCEMTMVEGEEVVGMTAGEKLRAAREAAKMSLEDVATSTRIPTRHLESLENGDFARLPAPTYSVGFAKSYAGAVGLDRNEIGEQLRAEIGGTRLSPYQAEQYEAVDPARTMPRWLIAAAVAAIILVAVLASWLNRRAQQGPDHVAANAAAPAEAQPAAPPPAVATAQPVVISATQPAWIQVKDGATMLREGVLAAGESFAVPATAAAPTLTTAKSEALKITVGNSVAAPVGPPATRVANVSLLPDALLHPAAAAPTVAPVEAKPAAPARTAPRPAARKPAAAPATPPATAPTNTADASTPPTNP